MFTLALKQIYRHPKYPLAIGIGVMLAVSMIAGTSLAVDNIAKVVFQNELDKIPVDFLVDRTFGSSSQLPSTSELKSQLFQVSEIKSIEMAWHIKINNHIFSREPYSGNETDFSEILANTPVNKIISLMILGVPSDFGENVSGITWIEGTFISSENNSIAIPETFASEYNLSVGDVFYLSALYNSYNITIMNYTNYIRSTKFYVAGIYRFNPVFETIFHKLEHLQLVFLATFSNAYKLMTQLSIGYVNNIQRGNTGEEKLYTQGAPNFATLPFLFRIYIFLDRNKVYQIWNMEEVNKKARRIENAIFTQLFMDVHYNIRFVASDIVNKLSEWTARVKYQFSLFYIPIIIVSVFLTVSVSYSLLENRKGELNLLIVRGAEKKQIRNILLLEGLIIGLVASALGVALAAGINALIMYILALKWNITITFTNYIPVVDVYTLFGFVVGIILAVSSVFLVTRELDILQKKSSSEERIQKTPTITSRRLKLLLIGEVLSVYKIIAWLVNFSIFSLYLSASTMNFLLMLIIYLFVFFDFFILSPLAPFLFIYCTARLAFIYENKIALGFVKLLSKLTKSTLVKLSISGLMRNPKRYLRASFVLALAIGFGVFIPIVQASQVQYNIRVMKIENGADINIQTMRSATIEDIAEINKILNISGVENLTYIFFKNVNVKGSGSMAFAINPEKYLSVTRENIAENFSQNGLIETLKEMKENTSYAIATESFLRYHGMKIGDVANVTVQINNTVSTSFSIKIIDAAYVLPGFDPNHIPLGNDIILNSKILKSVGAIYTQNATSALITYVLVDVAPSADATKIGEIIRQSYDFYKVKVIQEEINAITKNIMSSTIADIVNIEYFIMFFMATVGTGFVILLEVTERKREFAIMLARGISITQLTMLIFFELFFVAILFILIGFISGYIGGMGYLLFVRERSLLFMTGLYAIECLNPQVVIPPTVFYAILGSVTSLITVLAIPILVIRRTNIREALQSEIQ